MPVSKKTKPKTGKTTKKKKKPEYLPKHVSHTNKPENMPDKEWQAALRRQLAEKEVFDIKNIGSEPVYSDYSVFSPQSQNTYKTALRSKDNTLNFCSCPDFKTNLLGTCKHIEAVRLYLSKKRGIKKLLGIIPEIPYSSLYVSYTDNRQVKLRIGTDNTEEFKKWGKKYFNIDNTLLPAAYFDIELLLEEARGINASFRCYDDAKSLIIEKRADNHRHNTLKKQGPKILKGLVNATLFPYQAEGVLFAAKAGRCILADDMGLGKTLQAIAWARLMQKHFKTTKAIIVCPTSLKYQWKSEIEKFTGLPACVIEGNQLLRKKLYENDESYFKVVSYHMAGNDWQLINDTQPDVIILDEAQRIKNWRAKISVNVKRLRSPYAMVLTGTPVENNIEELYSLVQYIDQYLLGSLHNFLSAHQQRDNTGKVLGYRGLNEIGQRLSGIMLRRTKKEVLKQLPLRMDKNLFVPLTEQQKSLHSEYYDTVSKLVTKWRKTSFLSEKERQVLLNCLNMMRMVCDSTYIIDQETNYQTKLDELFNILDELFVNPDEKVVIFSQWERMTRLIANGLRDRKVKFENLHGGIPSKGREALFTNFNADPECRVFLSTDAGGVGLNLQSAANLINMDIPWNPAVLEQRIARIYRMGQTKNVSITNIIAQDSIEHEMLSKLKFKSAIADGILDNGEDSIFAGDDKFKKFMESIEALTSDTVSETSSFDQGESEEISESFIAEDGGILLTPALEDVYEEVNKGHEAEPSETETEAAFNATAIPGPTELIQNGVNFLSQLMATLSNPAAVKELTGSLTEKDEKTGQTYLKIPIHNAEIVENALSFLSGLFNSRK
jgi:SNF2 family DNA or RNA helicase